MVKTRTGVAAGCWAAVFGVLVCHSVICVASSEAAQESLKGLNPAGRHLPQGGADSHSSDATRVEVAADQVKVVRTQLPLPPGAEEVGAPSKVPSTPEGNVGREVDIIAEDAKPVAGTRVSWKPVKPGEGIAMGLRTLLAAGAAVWFSYAAKQGLQGARTRYGGADRRSARQYLAIAHLFIAVAATALVLHSKYVYNFFRRHRKIVATPPPEQETSGTPAGDAQLAEQAHGREERSTASARSTRKKGLVRKIAGYDLVQNMAIAAAAWLGGMAFGTVNFGEQSYRTFSRTAAARHASVGLKAFAVVIAAVTALRAAWRGAKAAVRAARGGGKENRKEKENSEGVTIESQ